MTTSLGGWMASFLGGGIIIYLAGWTTTASAYFFNYFEASSSLPLPRCLPFLSFCSYSFSLSSLSIIFLRGFFLVIFYSLLGGYEIESSEI